MSTQQLTKDKIDAAANACSAVHKSWSDATDALAGGVGVNGYGIFNDRHELRRKLESARSSINVALKSLDGIDWPTDTDYDQL